MNIQWAKYLIYGLAPLALLAAPAFGAMASDDCIGCHGDRDAVESRLFIDPLQFAGTEHADVGCPSCHVSVSDQHPDDGMTPSKASCGECHEDIATEYAKSAHGANADCNDCHNPHAARGAIAVSGYEMNRQCAACHDVPDMVRLHDEWLPQAALHVDSLPCVTCHTASPNYVITLYIHRRTGGRAYGDFQPAAYNDLQELTGGKSVATLVDTDNNHDISLAELKAFNADPRYKSMRLSGMLTPEQVTHNVQILDNRWDCTFCHASGPSAMQTSYLAFPEEDGSWARYGVEKGAVLHALYGTPDFYMMGATRSKTLNIVGLMIIAGGLVMPIGHGAMRFLTRKNRKDH